MKRFIAWMVVPGMIGLILLPVTAQAQTGGGSILSPRPGAAVPRGSIPVRVHVGASLVGTRAAILTVPGWSLSLYRQPRGSVAYSTLRIPGQTFTVRAPQPARSGRYTLRLNRDTPQSISAIAQVRVIVRTFTVTGLRASQPVFYPLVHDGYKDCTVITWTQSLAGSAVLEVQGKGRVVVGPRSSGQHHYQWCGSVGGRKLGQGAYRLAIRATESGTGTTVTSRTIGVSIKTATLNHSWTVTLRGNQTLGYHTFHRSCRAYINVIQYGDAYITCNASGVAALFWRVNIPRAWQIGHYHYAYSWRYRYRSANHNSLVGQFSKSGSYHTYVIEEIGQTHSWLEIVKVVTNLYLTTTI